MQISLIVAVADNGVIGRDNDLVWKLKDDMKFFSDTTKGHAIITGRRNYESIPEKFRPLPQRVNVVITRNPSYLAPGAHVVHGLDEAIAKLSAEGAEQAFIIGGGQIYREAMLRQDVRRILLTHVHAEPEGDTFFDLEALNSGWNAVKTILEGARGDRNEWDFKVVEYQRVDA